MPKAAKKPQKHIDSCEIGGVALFYNSFGKVHSLFSILFLTSFSCLLLNFRRCPTPKECSCDWPDSAW